jgi:hypothetical protein
MPNRIVVVHDKIEFLAQAVISLRLAEYEVAHFTDPSTAQSAFGRSQRIGLLITRTFFAPGTLNGGSLALMAKIKWPDLKIIFLEPPEYSLRYLRFGETLPSPVSMLKLMTLAKRLLPPLCHQ